MSGRRTMAVVAITAGVGLTAVLVAGMLATGQSTSDPVASAPQAGAGLARSIATAQATLRHSPDDFRAWADLGGAYVEQARVSGDPTYYPKAQGALDESLALRPNGNGPALIGMGALANARHDFAGAKAWGARAVAAQPDTAAAHGVLADALTQLGDERGATAAVQRMLTLRPGVAAFTRASYDLELHGNTGAARAALDRALADAVSPDETAFCQYYLGELAFNTGDLDTAATHYAASAAAVHDYPGARQGTAKVAAARGRLDDAVAGYAALVAARPLPQYLQEYAELLTAAGRPAEATAQLDLLAGQERLLAAAGATDDLSASLVAAEFGSPAEALRTARAEWGRRQNVHVADAFGWALHLNGRDAEAIGYADRAAALGTRSAAFAYHRGMILAALGRDAEAAGQLDLALSTNPYFSPTQAAKARAALGGVR
jgi:tetratricopeptide (TPR) repeat protein